MKLPGKAYSHRRNHNEGQSNQSSSENKNERLPTLNQSFTSARFLSVKIYKRKFDRSRLQEAHVIFFPEIA